MAAWKSFLIGGYNKAIANKHDKTLINFCFTFNPPDYINI
jgi:hypothetical protein